MDHELQSRLAALEAEFAAARARWEEERASLLVEIRKLRRNQMPQAQVHRPSSASDQAARELQDSRFHLYLDEWVEFFRRVIALWKERPQLPPPEFESRRTNLETECDELLGRELRWAGDKKVQKRLKRKHAHLLTCLHDPYVEPTNNRAERSLRPAVIARKLSCGNRTILGKQTWEIINTLAVTCHQKAESLIDYLTPKLQLAAA